MKHFFLSATVVLMSAFAVVSCNDDDDAVAASISADKTSVTYDYARSVQRLDVTATVAWTAATDASWIHLTKTSYEANENRVIFIVDENPTKDARKGTITVSCSAGSVTFTITQDGGHAVDVPTKHYDIISDGGTLKITMSANTDVEVEVTEGNDWLTFDEIGGMGTQFPYMLFEADPNNGTDERYATVKVKEAGASEEQAITLTLTQRERDQFNMAETPEGQTERNVPGSEDTELVFDFATNVSYLESISDPSWIIPVKEEPAETKANSLKDGELKYTILKSTAYEERTGTVTIVKYGTETEMVKFTIKQAGNPILSVDPTFIASIANGITADAKVFNIKLTSNLPKEPSAESSADWARFSKSVDGLSLTVDKNDSGADRTATLTISDPDGKAEPVELTLKQKK